MDSASFCGQTCHVMEPEFTAYQLSAHSQVGSVDCRPCLCLDGSCGLWSAASYGLAGRFPAVSNMLNSHHRDVLFLFEKRTPQVQRLNNAGNFQTERLDRQPAVVT